jgi:hypothetical protein
MTETDTQPPAPDPALRRLEPLVGDWSMTGNLVGSSEENIVGRASFRWPEGGVLLQQDIEIDFAGQFQVKSHELIGYDPETGAFASHVYSNLSPTPLPYAWELRDNKLRNSLPTAHWMRRSRERSQTTAPPSRAAGGRIPAPTKPSTSPMTSAVTACRKAPARGDAHTGSELTGGRRTELGAALMVGAVLRQPFRVRSAEGSRAMPVGIRSSVAIRFSSRANPSSADPPVEDADANGSVAQRLDGVAGARHHQTADQDDETPCQPQFWAATWGHHNSTPTGSNPCLHTERAPVLLR